jgi:hypothetical protein
MLLKNRDHLLLTSIILFCLLTAVTAQTDSLVLSNGNVMVGEMKSMSQGVLIMKTPYSKVDFNIKWIQVKEVYSKTSFLIALADGRRMNSILNTNKAGLLVIEDENGDLQETNILNLVFLRSAKTNFFTRVYGDFDAGLSFNKANNLKQINLSTNLGYLTDTWGSDAFYTYSGSSQDSISSTIRQEGGISFKYFLLNDWYLIPEVTYLTNTEQALNGRTTGRFGVGRYLAQSNVAYWGLVGGLVFNAETFTNETPSRTSAEAFAGSEINLFDTGDLTMLSNIYFYPSLTEKGRFRADFKFDIKYKIATDFYVKGNVTYNYDNQPAVEGNETDYVYGFSIGIKF